MRESIAAPGTICIEQLTKLIAAVNEAEKALEKAKSVLSEISAENSAGEEE